MKKDINDSKTIGQQHWQSEYLSHMGAEDKTVVNRSGIAIKPLYTPQDVSDPEYIASLGFPGQAPYTRGIYPTMHRGRSWTQRQLIGLGVPDDYNRRLKSLLDSGATAISLIPCKSVYRGYDADEVDHELLGTCGVVLNTVDDMTTCLEGIPIGEISTAMNDPLPFTLLALELAVAKRRGIPWEKISGTSNQSDYISHYVANHMFFRLSLEGSRRVLTDHIQWCDQHLPRWNPLSVVGQHMQQSGATPAQAMGLTLSSAIQFANDCLDRGMDPNRFLRRFTFFFDISISFFEEIAKFRAGRRIWTRIARDRFGATDPNVWRFKFHAQTSGVDLTRQQPLNNIARTTAQAMAGIFGGLQSLHTDAYDEVLSTPTEEAARIAIATQNILREEAHLTDVIDPLGGSWYVETLTDEMEEKICEVIDRIDEAGGMYRAVSDGFVQQMLGDSSLAFQDRVDSGEQTIVGVNRYIEEDDPTYRKPLPPPDPARISAQLDVLRAYRAGRDQVTVRRALDQLARASNSDNENVFGAVVDAAVAGVTHGEIVACLRREMGFGQPLIAA